MFESLTNRLSGIFTSLRQKGLLSEENIDIEVKKEESTNPPPPIIVKSENFDRQMPSSSKTCFMFQDQMKKVKAVKKNIQKTNKKSNNQPIFNHI